MSSKKIFLHPKKKDSLLYWVQSAGRDIRSLRQLADGSIYSQLIETLIEKNDASSVIDSNDVAPPNAENVPPISVPNGEENFIINQNGHELIDDKTVEEVSSIQVKNDSKNNDNVMECPTDSEIPSEPMDLISEECSNDSQKTEEDRTYELTEAAATDEGYISAIIKSESDVVDKQVLENPANNLNVDESGTKKNEPMLANGSSTSMEVSFNGNSVHESSVSNHVENGVTDIVVPASVHEQENNAAISAVDNKVDEQTLADETQRKYKVIKAFIESMLELNSAYLVSYSKAIEADEIELAKVTILLLSAMVQYSLSTNKTHIMAACYGLPEECQEEIMDCLELFLKKRKKPVEEKEFLARLSRTTRPRISPRKDMITPQQIKSKTPKKSLRGRKKSKNFEKVFESPFQSFIHSPDRRRTTPNSEARLLEAVRCKDKTISSLTYDLDVEKYNVDDLKKQNEDLISELNMQKKKIKELNADLNEAVDNYEKKAQKFEDAEQKMSNEIKRLKKQVTYLENEIKLRDETLQEDGNVSRESLGEVGLRQINMTKENKKTIDTMKEREINTAVQIDDLNSKIAELEKNLEEKEVIIKFNKNKEDERMTDSSIECKIITAEEVDKLKAALQKAMHELKESEGKSSYTIFNHPNVIEKRNMEKRQEELQKIINENKRDHRSELFKSRRDHEMEIDKLKKYIKELNKLNQDRKKESDKLKQDHAKEMQKLKVHVCEADKRREELLMRLKRSRNDKLRLQGKLQAFESFHCGNSICENVSLSSIQNTTNSEQTPATVRLISPTEKEGQLWNTISAGTSPTEINEPSIYNISEGSSSLLPQSNKNCDISNDIVNIAQRECSRRRSSRSRQERSETPEDSGEIETIHNGTNGRLSCTASEFNQIKTLVQNVTETIKGKNNQSIEVLFSLENVATNFNCIKDLVDFLKLIIKIISTTLGKCKRGDSGNSIADKDGDCQMHQQKIRNLKTKIMRIDTESKKLHKENEALKRRCIALEKDSEKKSENVSSICISELQQSKEKLQASLKQSQDAAKGYITKVSSLELKIKGYERELTSAMDVRDSNIERCRKAVQEREELKKRINAMEKNLAANKIRNNAPPPTVICDKCLHMKKRLDSYKCEKDDLEQAIKSLHGNLNILKSENKTQINRLKEMEREKKHLQQQLDTEKAWKTADCNGTMYRMSERLRASLIEGDKSETEESEDDCQSVTSVEKSLFTSNAEKLYNKALSSASKGQNPTKLSAFCKAEDEAEMLSQSSIAGNYPDSPGKRVKEFQRRNSLYHPHMRSVYALELNTTPSQEKYFITPSPVSGKPATSKWINSKHSVSGPALKKRKISIPPGNVIRSASSTSTISKSSAKDSKIVSSSIFASTPKIFEQKKYKTPASFIRMRTMLKPQKKLK